MIRQQKIILKQIQEERKKKKPDQKLIKSLAKQIVSYDDNSRLIRYSYRRKFNRKGGGKSSSFGVWGDSEDE